MRRRRLDRPWDRQIARLAVPAFGALVAEPLYVLGDTAVVGHLGTPQLAGLAIASSVLLTVHSLCTFLAYGTTSAVARLLGAGEDREAAHQAVQGLWLAVALGTVLAIIGLGTSGELVRALGADGDVARQAEIYLRISLPGLPPMMAVLAGTGYLRGLQDTRTPLVVAIVTAIGNVVLELILIYGFDLGIGASALSTVVAQSAAGFVYIRAVGRAGRRHRVGLRPHLASLRRLLAIGGALVVRTMSLRAALVVATAVAARIGTDDVGAHQVAYELWNFLALGLDAVAIAGQALVGRLLGAGDAAGARAAGRRMLELGLLAGIVAGALVLAFRTLLPELFTDDPAVRSLAAFLLVFVAALQPLNAVVFVLDGLHIGAGDMRFLAWAMAGAGAVSIAGFGAVLATDAGVGWLWAAIGLFMVSRAIPLSWRWASGRWAVVGATTR